MGKVAYICVHLNKIGLLDFINNIHIDEDFSKTTFLILGDFKKTDISTKYSKLIV